MLRPAIGETVAATRRVLDSAGVAPADLAAIVLVGGSSRIPLVSEMLSAEFGRPLALDNHPKHDVALGAAIRGTAAARPAAARSAPPPAQTGPAVATAAAAAAAGPATMPAAQAVSSTTTGTPYVTPATAAYTGAGPAVPPGPPPGPSPTGARPRPSAR